MTTAEYLEVLIDTKEDMKSAIESKNIAVTGGLVDYDDFIRQIPVFEGEIIYVPNGINIGFTDYDLGYWTDSSGVSHYGLPKMVGFDITDNPNFLLDGVAPVNGATHSPSGNYGVRYIISEYNIDGRHIIVVLFK